MPMLWRNLLGVSWISRPAGQYDVITGGKGQRSDGKGVSVNTRMGSHTEGIQLGIYKERVWANYRYQLYEL